MIGTIAVFGANGQDGLILVLSALAKGYRVIGLSRRPDRRLESLKMKNPRLKTFSDINYLESDLESLVKNFGIGHVFFFASDHGPSGSMTATREAQQVSEYLNHKLPAKLTDLARRQKIGLTLPSSSRVFSGYLTNSSQTKVLDSGDAFWPTDYYGEHKAKLLERAALSRQDGVRVFSPILFNHDSIFKKKGYIGWAIAEYVASSLRSKPLSKHFRHPASLLDLSNAVEVCEILLDDVQHFQAASRLVSTCEAIPLPSLIMKVGEFLRIDVPVVSYAETGGPCLIADKNDPFTSKTSVLRTVAALSAMTLSLDQNILIEKRLSDELKRNLPAGLGQLRHDALRFWQPDTSMEESGTSGSA